MHNYVVTAHKPSQVTHTAVGNFLGPDQRNLLVAKVNYIQVYTITPEGLVCSVVLPIFGTISVMQLMRQPNDQQDSLIILTDKYKLCVVKWNSDDARCHVISSGDTHDHCASNEVSERIGVVDPLGRCIALYQSNRILRIIPTAPDADKTAFNVRLLEDAVIDMAFLHGCPVPTIAILCTVSKVSHELHTYEVSMPEQDVAQAVWRKFDLDATTNKIVAVPEPYGGALIFGDELISYVSTADDDVNLQIDTVIIKAVGQVGECGSRFLIGDHKGHLMMLMLCRDEKGKCISLKLEPLGETSIAHTISYLDSGFVYIGSSSGDSQLIRLSTTPLPSTTATTSYVEVVHTFPHLGPIVDFCIVKGMGYLRQGQGQVVTCSGIGKDGSLRIIRNGIGISEYASEELPGITDLFSLRRTSTDRYDRYLVQSFTSETRMLELVSAEEMAPATVMGFDEDSRTLYAANMNGDVIVQVTVTGVRIIDCSTMTGRGAPVWTPPGDVRISVACGNEQQLLIGTTGGNAVLLTVDAEEKTVVEKSHRKMSNEISCVNCNVLETKGEMTDDDKAVKNGAARIAAIGLWSEVGEVPVVELVALPSLKTVERIEIGGDTIARGVLLVTLENYHYLIVALGDGSLVTYSVKSDSVAQALANLERAAEEDEGNKVGVVSERRKFSVGTKPAELRIFKSKGADHVFVACDRPTVVYSSTGGGKLLVSNVNLQEVTRVCGFDTEGFPECLAIATESGLHLGAVDEIQKLHISSVPLGEQPRRIEYLESSRVFAILTERMMVVDDGGDEVIEHSLKLVDDSRHDSLDRFKLNLHENGCCLLACRFKGENIDKDEEFLVLGTALLLPNQEDPKEGRVVLIRVVDGQIVLVAEMKVPGAVYDLKCFKGMLVASIASEVWLVSVSARKDGSVILKEEDRHDGFVLGLKIALRGEFIVVGDLLRSIRVLTCKKSGYKVTLEEVARDHGVLWALTVEVLDDETYIVAEHEKHLVTFRRNSRAATEEERKRLERVGQFHLGERVNRIEHGSLVMQMTDQDGPALNTLIFGTTSGMLGVIAQLKPEVFNFMVEVENAMATLIPGVGGLKHADWREMVLENGTHTARAGNFVDGDLVERFLDLNPTQMARVSAMVNVTVEELVQRVEEMQRLHGAG